MSSSSSPCHSLTCNRNLFSSKNPSSNAKAAEARAEQLLTSIEGVGEHAPDLDRLFPNAKEELPPAYQDSEDSIGSLKRELRKHIDELKGLRETLQGEKDSLQSKLDSKQAKCDADVAATKAKARTAEQKLQEIRKISETNYAAAMEYKRQIDDLKAKVKALQQKSTLQPNSSGLSYVNYNVNNTNFTYNFNYNSLTPTVRNRQTPARRLPYEHDFYHPNGCPGCETCMNADYLHARRLADQRILLRTNYRVGPYGFPGGMTSASGPGMIPGMGMIDFGTSG